MQTHYLIAVNEFCTLHNIEESFVSTLQENGLIELKILENTGFIQKKQLDQLEKFIRFYYDLDINIEGIETINHLLDRMNDLQHEITTLRNRLRLYE